MGNEKRPDETDDEYRLRLSQQFKPKAWSVSEEAKQRKYKRAKRLRELPKAVAK